MKDFFEELSEPVNFNVNKELLNTRTQTINRLCDIYDTINDTIQSLRELDIINLSEKEKYNGNANEI